jgi:hypothetical protein
MHNIGHPLLALPHPQIGRALPAKHYIEMHIKKSAQKVPRKIECPERVGHNSSGNETIGTEIISSSNRVSVLFEFFN